MKKQVFFQKPALSAAKTTLIGGVVVHLFGLVQYISNFDNISMMPYGFGTGITSGRWLLELLGNYVGSNGGNFNLPTVNGFVFIWILAIAAGFLVSALNISQERTAALIGLLFVSFPTVTATMFFRYTAIYYGIAILLSVLAAWFMHCKKFGVAASAVCTAMSLGIYQAYVPLTIGIMVLLLIQAALKGEKTFKELVLQGLSYCAALLLGLVLYYLCLNFFLNRMDTDLSYYQGVNEMGRLNLQELPALVWRAFSSACTFAVEDYCGLANIPYLKFSYLVLWGIAVFEAGLIWFVQNKKYGHGLFIVAMLFCFPLAINFIVLMCPVSNIYTLMVYAFVLVPCLPFAVHETAEKGKDWWKYVQKAGSMVIAALAAIVIMCNAYYANVNYASLYHVNEQVKNYLNGMIVQVRMTDGFDTEKKWAFIGQNIEDPLLGSLWDKEANYGGNATADLLLNTYGRVSWIENYMGYDIEMEDETVVAQLVATAEVESMPCWPNKGSVEVIDNTIVIKLQNVSP